MCYHADGRDYSVTANIKGIPSSKAYLVGARQGVAAINATTGKLHYLHKFWQDAGEDRQRLMRSNDGAVDSRGRLWVGSMVDPHLAGEERPEGALFKVEITSDGKDLTSTEIVTSVQSPNGTAWNAADNIMYWTDSGKRSIFAFDFDADAGTVANQRTYWNAANAGYADGVNPDGLVIDAEDCIWTALWRGSAVVRLDPAGNTIGKVHLPTAYVTCPLFVDTKLVITTARDPDHKGETEDGGMRRGGDLYEVDVGVKGVPRHEFVLPADQKIAWE